ncbi:hypothetical protein GLAREA_05778 [Glarea lozoyensis ATCC 20868]|uniref:Uncharacterized protein n=1 Tax=Glarea lozoyensis (strain ATCC 20868 / MF5171) TaxID=1116229 RepID=S3DFA0_GLAL2|nr:uncharacterized protein GLAREA_05778 [Glarea lozoyensis ATCC 20868]EPE36440.1 hypothetical protein GLAREA_05778 [Glarea lozoyensis ATCC 20868]
MFLKTISLVGFLCLLCAKAAILIPRSDPPPPGTVTIPPTTTFVVMAPDVLVTKVTTVPAEQPFASWLANAIPIMPDIPVISNLVGVKPTIPSSSLSPTAPPTTSSKISSSTAVKTSSTGSSSLTSSSRTTASSSSNGGPMSSSTTSTMRLNSTTAASTPDIPTRIICVLPPPEPSNDYLNTSATPQTVPCPKPSPITDTSSSLVMWNTTA